VIARCSRLTRFRPRIPRRNGTSPHLRLRASAKAVLHVNSRTRTHVSQRPDGARGVYRNRVQREQPSGGADASASNLSRRCVDTWLAGGGRPFHQSLLGRVLTSCGTSISSGGARYRWMRRDSTDQSCSSMMYQRYDMNHLASDDMITRDCLELQWVSARKSWQYFHVPPMRGEEL
jgi:hypothetical protein